MLLALEIVYLLVANAFLMGWAKRLFSSGSDLVVNYERAYTLWPGQVELRELRVVFSDDNVQFSLDLPRARDPGRPRQACGPGPCT